jgi:hypothetical protein
LRVAFTYANCDRNSNVGTEWDTNSYCHRHRSWFAHAHSDAMRREMHTDSKAAPNAGASPVAVGAAFLLTGALRMGSWHR